MYASVRALLNQLIDYAGLFPPAKLPLEQALAEYLHFKRSSPHAWMLGRFICPAARLAELVALAKSHPEAARLSLSVLAGQLDLSESLLPLLPDFESIAAFRVAWGADSVIDTIEIPLAKDGNVEKLVHHLGYVATHMDQEKLRGFLEMPRSSSWLADTAKIAKGIGSLSEVWDAGLLGLKLRCGGLKADAFPSDEEVAQFIACCVGAKIPFKATAGLHHPRRHWDSNLDVWHHGFLNVFGAGLLAMCNHLNTDDLAAILGDRDAQHFQFDDTGFRWRDWGCTTEQIVEFRRTGPISFGSCSIAEPCTDLAALGLLH